MQKTVKRYRRPASKKARWAKVVLDLSGANLEIEESENVFSVTDVDSSNLVVHFGKSFRDNLYRCDVIPSEPTGYEVRLRTEEGVGIHLPAPRPKKIKIVCEAL